MKQFKTLLAAMAFPFFLSGVATGFTPEEAYNICDEMFWSNDSDHNGVLEHDEMVSIGQFIGYYFADLNGDPVHFGSIAADTDGSHSIDSAEWITYCTSAIYIAIGE